MWCIWQDSQAQWRSIGLYSLNIKNMITKIGGKYYQEVEVDTFMADATKRMDEIDMLLPKVQQGLVDLQTEKIELQAEIDSVQPKVEQPIEDKDQ